MTGVDFTAARPRDLHLTGINLGTPGVDIRLPEDDAHWTISDWPAFLDRVQSLAQQLPPSREQTTTSIWVEYARKESGPSQRTGFLAVWDLHHLGGTALTNLLRSAR